MHMIVSLKDNITLACAYTTCHLHARYSFLLYGLLLCSFVCPSWYQAGLTIIHLLRASSGCSIFHDRADIEWLFDIHVAIEYTRN